MPKMKTIKAIKARFKVTGTGKLKRGHAGKRHLLGDKSSKRKRHLSKPGLVNKAQTAKYKVLIGA